MNVTEELRADQKLIHEVHTEAQWNEKCNEVRGQLNDPNLRTRERDALHATLRSLYEQRSPGSHSAVIGCDGISRLRK